jgi:hypothetical protein
MKRDPRLRGLSSQHHDALVLSRRLAEFAGSVSWSSKDATRLGDEFDREIDPHFRVEEELLLPALRQVDQMPLVVRTEVDHAFLRNAVAAARTGNAAAALAFGERLRAHVRFEEGELFPVCEATLPSAVLYEVARRSKV